HCCNVWLLQFAGCERMVGSNLHFLPEHHRYLSILVNFVLGRTGRDLADGERYVVDLFLVRKLFHLRLELVRIVGQENNKRRQLLVFVLAYFVIDLLDQTGQGPVDLACKHADYGIGSELSPVTQAAAVIFGVVYRAGLTGNVANLEWTGKVPDL